MGNDARENDRGPFWDNVPGFSLRYYGKCEISVMAVGFQTEILKPVPSEGDTLPT
jgi:hypothetical protein